MQIQVVIHVSHLTLGFITSIYIVFNKTISLFSSFAMKWKQLYVLWHKDNTIQRLFRHFQAMKGLSKQENKHKVNCMHGTCTCMLQRIHVSILDSSAITVHRNYLNETLWCKVLFNEISISFIGWSVNQSFEFVKNDI